MARADEIAPIEPSEYASVTVPIIGTTATNAPVIIEKLRAGTVTPEAAWQSGELKLDDVLYLLGNYFDPWGGIDWKDSGGVRLSLAKLIVEHAPEKLAKPQELPLRVRLWVGDYLQSVNDERAVALLESVLSEFKEAKVDQDPAVFQAAERLATYYGHKSEWEKAAQAWLRVVPLHLEKDWRVADAQMQAARLYTVTGQDDKARAAWDKVERSGNQFFIGLGLLDRGTALIERGQYDAARALLDRPMSGDTQVQIISIAQLCRLAFLEYRLGNFEPMREHIQNAVAQYDVWKAANPNANDFGLGQDVRGAKLYELYLERWKAAPVTVMPESLRFVVSNDLATPQTLKKRLSLRTYRKAAFKVSVDAPQVKVFLSQGEWTGQRRAYAEQEVTVEVEAAALNAGQKPITATVTITMEGEKTFTVRVPVTIVADGVQP